MNNEKKQISISQLSAIQIIKERYKEQKGELTKSAQIALSILNTELTKKALPGQPYNLANGAVVIQQLIDLMALGLKPKKDFDLIQFGKNTMNVKISVHWQAWLNIIFARSVKPIARIKPDIILGKYKIVCVEGKYKVSYAINFETKYKYEDIIAAIVQIYYEDGTEDLVYLDQQQLTNFRKKSSNGFEDSSPYVWWPKEMALAKVLNELAKYIRLDLHDTEFTNLDELDGIQYNKENDPIIIKEGQNETNQTQMTTHNKEVIQNDVKRNNSGVKEISGNTKTVSTESIRSIKSERATPSIQTQRSVSDTSSNVPRVCRTCLTLNNNLNSEYCYFCINALKIKE